MEIYGIGTDIIEISRIEKAIKQTSLFKRKVYTEKEIKEKAQGLTIQISISHSRKYAVSTVIIYKK